MPGNVLNVQLSDGIADALRAVDRAGRSRALRMVMGVAVAAALVANFERLDAERHRNEAGVRYYAGAAQAVQRPQVSGDEVVVAVNQEGIAQRYYGGTIVAGSNGSGKQWITIPAIPAALGRRAGSFANLRFVFFGPDLAALVSDDRARVNFKQSPGAKKKPRGVALVPQEHGKLPVVYWLRRSVVQAPDPSVIPDEETLATTAYREGTNFLQDTIHDVEGGTPA